MTTLDDKLLGEKTHNYCSSSSEDDEREEEDSGESESPPINNASSSSPLVKSPLSNSKIDINDTGRWKGFSQNTGPKGVIRDWQLYKEHEESLKVKNEVKLAEDIKKHCITVGDGGGESEIDELMSDEVLRGFVEKRMGEIRLMGKGRVDGFKEIFSGDEFLAVVDGFEGVDTSVVIHIYDDGRVSSSLNLALKEISLKHRDVQFCCVKAGCVGVSSLFKRKGVPAVLVYQKGNLVGNFVGVCGEIGEEFGVEDVEEWLEGKGVFGGGGSVRGN